MERKIGETFEFKGKTYEVAELPDYFCAFCDLEKECYSKRSYLENIAGTCSQSKRMDTRNVCFKEIKKDMEIKDNKLTINIPDGMEIDLQNSNFDAGVIKFRKKELTYEDIQDSIVKYLTTTLKRFKGKYYLWKECDEEYYSKERTKMLTSVFEKANDDDAQTYIKTIEKKLGGKFNRETLEVEQPHPEFKDGDIITITPQIGNNLIFIFRAEDVEKYYCHAFIDGNIAIVNDDGYCKKDFCTARPSTEEEKKQLFSALAKKGKVWDAEKKAIVDFKPKWKPKPFDKVITRVDDNAIWTANIFSHVDQHGKYVTIGCISDYPYCLPYNEETAKLIGTTNNWEG